MLPRAILVNSFLVSHNLLLFHSPKDSWNKLQNMRNSENISDIALGTMQWQLLNFEIWVRKRYDDDQFAVKLVGRLACISTTTKS